MLLIKFVGLLSYLIQGGEYVKYYRTTYLDLVSELLLPFGNMSYLSVSERKSGKSGCLLTHEGVRER